MESGEIEVQRTTRGDTMMVGAAWW